MKKGKFIYTLSALMMACIISFSGVGGSYIQAHATSVGIEPGVWNDDESAWENIRQYIKLFTTAIGVYLSPNVSSVLLGADSAQDFYDFMIEDGVSHDVAHGVFCDCDDSTHTSISGNEYGGGGHVRDGIGRDEDGNVTYSDDVSDLFYKYIYKYLETECGYFVVETMSADEIPLEWFGVQNSRDNVVQTIKNFGICGLRLKSFSVGSTVSEVQLYYTPNINSFVNGGLGDTVPRVRVKAICSEGDSYVEQGLKMVYWTESNPYYSFTKGPVSFDNIHHLDSTSSLLYITRRTSFLDSTDWSIIVSSDGRLVKVWDSLDAFLNHNIKQQPYYYTQNWVNYDASQDNSITMTSAEYQYYSDNSTTIFQTIQNNIDNSGSDLTEEDIQKIVEDAVKEIKDSISDNSGSGDNGNSGDNGDSGDNEDSGGTGVGDLIEGIGKIFDTILSLIGKLMGVVADFTQSILDLFSGFTTFTDGFSDFLAGAFSFIPAEVWDIIKVGLYLMVLTAIIKFLRK